jgi:hypothetical protein
VEVSAGDVIEIPGNKVQEPSRRGVVERVVDPEPLRIEVRWEDGHTSLFQPAGGTMRVVDSSGRDG